MSVQTPPRLLDLAGQSLLRDQALAVAALEHLPAELFPPLFMQAFFGRHRETLTAMVHAWPFACLPLGGLMQMPQRGTLQATFDGLDILLAQKVRPRRWKLQVLDLRNTNQCFWSMWSGARTQVHPRTRPAAARGSGMRQPAAPLEVLVDLCLSSRIRDRFFPDLIRWAKQREGLLHLCCQTLKIFEVPIKAIKALALVRLDCIQEVEVNCPWSLSALGVFAPYLGQMSNVRRLSLSHIHMPASEAEEWELRISQFTSQFLWLPHLRKLYLESPAFLTGRLDQMLRCLQTCLETLSITNCVLTELDLMHLSLCPNLGQLKDLDLSGVCLTGFNPEPLRALLEDVAATLQHLDLVYCGIRDSHVKAIVPVLSRCRQLRALSLSGNLLSLAALEELLRHTAGLRSLSHELYPPPLESYSAQGVLEPGRLAQVRDALTGILRDLGQPRTIWLSTSPCPRCGQKVFYDVEPILFSCNNPA
ncbi:PRAME family member 12-like [Pteronotus mesoamericanus]|uniref:PRAME family member 12-like n=1 Tax=Pteronotus mesoamericanus TaxID=1884717 RepID=UPI0023EC8E1A|nr:PRAME family member 12-like [Pteronotus parnellii mesoamericanus]